MNELSIEEKAKRYDEVSKEVKDFFEGRQKMYSDVNQTLEYLFPELKKSKGEMVRKALIDTIKFWGPVMESPYMLGISKEDILTWLEKQGEQKLVPDWMPKFLDELRSKKKLFRLGRRQGHRRGYPCDYQLDESELL